MLVIVSGRYSVRFFTMRFEMSEVRVVPVMRIFPVKSPVFSVNTLSYRSTVKMVFSSAMMLFVFNAPW